MQTKETRMYYISAKIVNEQIKTKFFFFCHENFMCQKRTDEMAALDERLLAITMALRKAPFNSSRLWAAVFFGKSDRGIFRTLSNI